MASFSKSKSRCIKANLSISHNGYHWIAKGDGVQVTAKELRQLDKEINQKFKQTHFKSEFDYADIFMSFDNQTIPEWIRQYSNHYFNRRLRIYFDK